MNITSSDVILLAHSTFGVLGTISAVWVFVEALNARVENAGRIRNAAFISALCMTATWIVGGYWYVHFYPADRALILAGPWPFAHTLFMETKEHLFFIPADSIVLLADRRSRQTLRKRKRAKKWCCALRC